MTERAPVYLYAFTGGELLDGLPLGLFGSPVEGLAEAGLTALISRLDRPLDASIETVAAHGAVCDAALDLGALVPVRFGIVLPDGEHVRELMSRHGSVLRQTLGHLEDHVELGLTILKSEATDPESDAPKSGRAHLLHLSGAPQHPDIERLHGDLSDLAVESRVRPGGGAPVLFKAAYFVSKGMVPAMRARLNQDPGAARGWSLCLTGPWPAYHFVADDLLTADSAWESRP